jgi:tellurite resistance protein TerA
VNLSKVSLTKSSPTVSLTKATGASGQMRINLNWSQGGKPAGGFLKRAMAANSSVDLDIGCLWETTDGRKGVVQALGNAFGDLHGPPYVFLDGDDRSGTNTGGENLIVNLDRLDQIRRVLVYAYIYEGAPNWAAADGVVTLFPVGAAPIEIRLDETSNSHRFCAIAMLSNVGGTLQIDRQVQYIAGSQSNVDQAYGWGLRWSAGRK